MSQHNPLGQQVHQTNASITTAKRKMTDDESRPSADIYGCRDDAPLTLLVRYLTGRLPPPSPHTLSSRAMPWFIPSIVEAFSSAALHETDTVQYDTTQYSNLYSSQMGNSCGRNSHYRNTTILVYLHNDVNDSSSGCNHRGSCRPHS